LNELDYAIIALLAISVIVGIVRGAIREVINFAGWILAFFLAHAFARDLAAYFADWMAEPVYRTVIAWMSIFLLVLVISAMFASLVSELVRKLGLGGLNQAFGALIGLLRGALVLLVLTLAAGMTKFPQSALWKGSASTPWLEVAALHARALLPESLASRITYQAPKLRQALGLLQG
jgi:membrane protein required for colicin V production